MSNSYRINFGKFNWNKVANFVQISPTRRGRMFPALNDIISDNLCDENWIVRRRPEGSGSDKIWVHKDTQIIRWDDQVVEIVHNDWFEVKYIRINKVRRTITVDRRQVREMRWPIR